MATWVSFLDLKTGVAFDVNVADPNVADLRTIPDSVLTPLGLSSGAGTYIEYDTGHKTAVRGTLAATAAAFAGGGVAPSKAVYVDTAGNDSTGQRGNAAFPFLTMSAALAVCQSGDELLVSPGSYTGTLNHATLPAIANLTIRGSGEFPSETVVSGAAGEDVLTLNGANRSIVIENIQIAGLTTGRAVVGTGATAARNWLSSGLFFSEAVITSAAGNALELTYAGLVEMIDSQITTGAVVLNVCGQTNIVSTFAGTSSFLYSWDQADALRPIAGVGTLLISAGSEVGAVTLAGGAAVDATHGSPSLKTTSGTKIGALTGLRLDDVAGAALSIIVRGEVGAVDFQSTAAKVIPAATANTLVLDFQGAILNGTGASAFLMKATTNFQTVFANGLMSKTASTFTADAKIHLTLTGAALTSPSFATPGADGDILPPELSGTIDIAAGGVLARTWAQLGYAGLIRVSSATYAAHVTSAIQAADAVCPVAGRVATGLTITSTAQAGNTAMWSVRWPA